MLKKISAILIFSVVCGKISAQYKGGVSDGYTFCLLTRTIVLPIELLNFDISFENKSVVINWSTLSETNNEYFEIEKSYDFTSWIQIAQIKGANNSNQLIKYLWNDINPSIGISYYRIKQVDFDGKFTFSKVLSLKIREIDNKIIVAFPNPVSSDILYLNLNSEDPFLITMYSISGQFVFRKKLNSSSIELPNLMRGDYTLQFENLNTGNVQFIHIVKE